MADDVGTFRVDIEIENPVLPGVKERLKGVLVDTGAELSWMPADVLESLGIERRSRWWVSHDVPPPPDRMIRPPANIRDG